MSKVTKVSKRTITFTVGMNEPYIAKSPLHSELRHNLKCTECGVRYSLKSNPLVPKQDMDIWLERRKKDAPFGKRSVPIFYEKCKECALEELRILRLQDPRYDGWGLSWVYGPVDYSVRPQDYNSKEEYAIAVATMEEKRRKDDEIDRNREMRINKLESHLEMF